MKHEFLPKFKVAKMTFSFEMGFFEVLLWAGDGQADCFLVWAGTLVSVDWAVIMDLVGTSQVSDRVYKTLTRHC